MSLTNYIAQSVVGALIFSRSDSVSPPGADMR